MMRLSPMSRTTSHYSFSNCYVIIIYFLQSSKSITEIVMNLLATCVTISTSAHAQILSVMSRWQKKNLRIEPASKLARYFFFQQPGKFKDRMLGIIPTLMKASQRKTWTRTICDSPNTWILLWRTMRLKWSSSSASWDGRKYSTKISWIIKYLNFSWKVVVERRIWLKKSFTAPGSFTQCQDPSIYPSKQNKAPKETFLRQPKNISIKQLDKIRPTAKYQRN